MTLRHDSDFVRAPQNLSLSYTSHCTSHSRSSTLQLRHVQKVPPLLELVLSFETRLNIELDRA